MGTDSEIPLSSRGDSSAARRARSVVSEINASRPLDAADQENALRYTVVAAPGAPRLAPGFLGEESKAPRSRDANLGA
jgi:hypothetical protein